jgi:hypothetical protein
MSKVKLSCENYGRFSEHSCSANCGTHINRCCAFCEYRRGLECEHSGALSGGYTVCQHLREQGPLFQMLMDAGQVEMTMDKTK